MRIKQSELLEMIENDYTHKEMAKEKGVSMTTIGTQIKRIDPNLVKEAYLKGYIYYNSAEILEINLNVEGIMVLRDSVTLEPIDYPFNIKINEEYSLNEEYFKEYYEKEQNILDIMAILWENIVLEVPMHLTNTKDAKLSGDGWSLGSNKNDEEIDPRLAKLTELLDERKE